MVYNRNSVYRNTVGVRTIMQFLLLLLFPLSVINTPSSIVVAGCPVLFGKGRQVMDVSSWRV